MTAFEPETVVVHSVTGPQGYTVATALTRAGYRVRGLAREPKSVPAGVEAIPADLDDAGSLVAAYKGAAAVFVNLPTDFSATALRHADNLIQALAQAEVQRVVFNPNLVPPPVEIGMPYVDARVQIAQGILAGPYAGSVVAPAAQYMENLNAPWSAALVTDDGVVAYPMPAEAPVPWVALDDIATAVVDVLGDPAAPPTTIVAGPQALTGHEVAAELGRGLSREVSWKLISGEEYRQMLAPYVGEAGAAGIGGMYGSILTGEAPPPPPPDPALVRAGSTTLADWAATQSWPYLSDARPASQAS